MESEEHGYIDILIRLGGGFKPKKFKNRELIVYDGGWYYWKKKAKISEMCVQYLKEAIIHGFVKYNVSLPS